MVYYITENSVHKYHKRTRDPLLPEEFRNTRCIDFPVLDEWTVFYVQVDVLQYGKTFNIVFLHQRVDFFYIYFYNVFCVFHYITKR